MQRLIVFLTVILFCAFTLQNIAQGIGQEQNKTSSMSKWILNNIIEEKLRIEPSELSEFLRDPIAFRVKQQKEVSTSTAPQKQKSRLQAITDKSVFASTRESEVHAAINPTDTANILCSANGVTGNTTNPIYYTNDFGTTWRKSNFSTSPRTSGILFGGGDPMFAFDANGKAYFSWINLYFEQSSSTYKMHMYWAESTNKGLTWQRNSTNDLVGGGDYDITNPDAPNNTAADKQWMMCDLSDSPNRNNLYCSFLLSKGGDNRVATKHKLANETQFSDIELRPLEDKDAHSFQQFSSVDIDEKGHIHSIYTACANDQDFTDGKLMIQHLFSTNAGKSWERETKIQSITFLKGNPNNQVNSPEAPVGISRVNVLPQIACDKFAKSKHKGNVYVAWTALGVDSRKSNGLDIYFSRSTDKGVTWSPAQIINDDVKDVDVTQSYVTIGVNEDGVIALCWYDRRDDPNNQEGHYYMSISYDGGVTFSKNRRVSSEPTDFSEFVGQRAFGVGEYNQVVMTKNYALPFWGDGRTGTGTQIYMAYVPLYDKETSVERISNINGDCNLVGVSPNPATSEVKIEYMVTENSALTMDIISSSGVVVSTTELGIQPSGKASYQLNTSALAQGVYMVLLRSPRSSSMMKLVVQR
jgi:hypothetical protein